MAADVSVGAAGENEQEHADQRNPKGNQEREPAYRLVRA